MIKKNSLADKLLYNIQRRGILTLSFYTLYRTVQRVIPFEILIFFEKELHRPIKRQLPKIRLKIKQANWDDIQHLSENDYNMTGLEKFEINGNYDCYVAIADRIVAYLWVSYNSIYDDEIFDLSLKENQAYIYKAFTHPEYRGLNIYPTMLSVVCEKLQRLKINKCFIATSIENRSSINGILKAGFEKMGYVMYFKVRNYKKVVLPKVLQTMATT